MSKQLYIIRHAKTQENQKGEDDFSRELSPKGEKQAKKLAGYFKKKKIKADLVLCSSSIRARQTLEQMGKVFPKADIVFDEKIYQASPKSLLNVMQKTSDKYKNVVVIGHNPAVVTLAVALTNTEKSNIKSLKKMLKKFPTAGMACFQLRKKNWQEMDVDVLKLLDFIDTKDV